MSRNSEPLNCICFVVLHFGDSSVTDLCIRSIQRLERGCGQSEQLDPVQIVIVDNDSRRTPEEREAFAERYEDSRNVTVIRTAGETGFSAANNLGYAYAREQLGADCIIVCNNDVEFVQRDFIRRLECSASGMACHVLGPNVTRRKNNEPQNPMDTRLRTKEEARYTIRMHRLAVKLLPVVYPLLRIQQKNQEKRVQKEKKKNIAYYRHTHKHIIPFGACLIFLPDFVRQEERAFEPETQFYYEEYILARRCFQKGYETGYDPRLKVVHETAAATRESAGSEYGRMRQLLKRTAKACEVYIEMIQKDE